MTGLELAAVGGTVATDVATRVAKRLLRSFLFRWQVAKEVRKSVDFDYPTFRYRAWLNTVTVDTLSKPLEMGGPDLAVSIDRALDTIASWRADPARDSHALSLVEATYAAMLRLTPEPEASALRDSWAHARHATLVEGLVELLDRSPKLDRADLSSGLQRSSDSRRALRLRSFGVSTDILDANVALDPEDSPNAGEIRILVGPYGSGKSELAESWFRSKANSFANDQLAPVPVWLHASELDSHSLTSIVSAQVDVSELQRGGVALVVDGLDEVDGTTAARISNQASVLVSTYPLSSAVLTCRPGILMQSENHIQCEGLDHESAIKLVERVAGTERSTWGWNPILIDTIRRPFFAIAAGLLISDSARPTGQADLMRRLAERALGQPSSASPAVTSTELFQLMSKIAMEATLTGNQSDGLNFRERQQARLSTLVSQRADGRVEFSLPLFQQWFAAQALLEDFALVEAALDSPETFDRWRWALAVAALDASPALLDRVLEACFRADPGAGAWMLARVSDGHRWFRSANGAIDPQTAASRLLRATRAVIDSIGPLAPLIYPVATPGQPITLGVSVAGSRVNLGWKLRVGTTDSVIPLPPSVHPLAPAGGDWFADRSGSVADGDEWPWILSRDRLETNVLDVFNHHRRLGPAGGVWHLERRYRVARAIVNDRSMYFLPLNAQDVLASAKGLIFGVPAPARAGFHVGHSLVDGEELLDLITWIESSNIAEIGRPLPVPDFPADKATSSWIWDSYSDERLMEFYLETYAAACVAYDQAASTVFSSFVWSLGRAAHGEFGVIADLSYRDDGWNGLRSPRVVGTMLPLAEMRHAAVASDRPVHVASNGRAMMTISVDGNHESWVGAFVRNLHQDASRNVSTNPFARDLSYWTTIADHVRHERPASLVAANWLFDDLKALDIAKGTFPQLED